MPQYILVGNQSREAQSPCYKYSLTQRECTCRQIQNLFAGLFLFAQQKSNEEIIIICLLGAHLYCYSSDYKHVSSSHENFYIPRNKIFHFLQLSITIFIQTFILWFLGFLTLCIKVSLLLTYYIIFLLALCKDSQGFFIY